MQLRFGTIFVLVAACAWPQAAVIPDTPAGHTLAAWLDAFNSGDRSRIQSYISKYEPAKSLDGTVGMREQTGGFELLGIDKSERLHIEFRVKEKAGARTAVGKIDVNDADPAVVTSFPLRVIPPGLTAADMNLKIDAATKSRVIDGAVTSLNEFYIFPETAKKMEDSLRARQKRGAYDNVNDGDTFARRLTDDLQEVSHDKHLRVNFVPRVLPKGEPERSPEADAQYRTQVERNNCAFQRVERLPSNIGYLKFDGFEDPAVCGATATAAMNFLAHVDAIIFDLRDNGGGEPAMVAYLSTYLFDEPTHLNDLYNRKEDSTTQYWTLP